MDRSQHEFDELLASLCDETITAAQFERLDQLLRTDPAARQRYLQVIHLHAGLQAKYHPAPALAVERSPGQGITGGQRAASPILGFLGNCLGHVGDVITKPTPFSLSMALLVVTSVLVLMATFYVPLYLGDGGGQPATPAEGTAGVVVARVSGLDDSDWVDGAVARRMNERLYAGDVVDLASGSVELTFSSNAQVVLQGAGRFRFDDKNSGTLLAGKLTAFVPSRAAGFHVDAPAARLVDLGTEFGIEVADSGVTVARVFDGEIEVWPRQADGTFADNKRKLQAGEALRIEVSGRLTELEADERQFVRAEEFGKPADYLRWLRFSQQMRHDPDLVAYYSFERRAGAAGRLINDAVATQGHFDGVLGVGDRFETMPRWTSGRWPCKRALAFDASSYRRVIIEDWNTANIDRAMSLAAWIRLRSNNGYQVLASQWAGNVRSQRLGQCFYLALRDPHNEFAGRGLPLSLRLSEDGGERGLRKSETADSTLSTSADGWMHVAFTVEAGGAVRLFKNGREVDVAAKQYEPNVLAATEQPLVLGGVFGHDRDCFDGWIDELAVFRRVVAPEEINQMFEAGKPATTAGQQH